MRGAMGILLVGGGVFLLIALFNGTLHFPIGNLGNGGNPLGNLFTSSTPQSLQGGVNPQKTPTPNATQASGKGVCPPGMQYDPSTNKCVNIYQGNR